MALAAIAPLLMAMAPFTFAEALDAQWPEVARASDGECDLAVNGNGRFYIISATGLEPGAAGRYVVTNGDMKPIDWQVRANGSGRFARYYLPFQWNRDGGVVDVAVITDRCSLSVSFPWQRAGTDAQ